MAQDNKRAGGRIGGEMEEKKTRKCFCTDESYSQLVIAHKRKYSEHQTRQQTVRRQCHNEPSSPIIDSNPNDSIADHTGRWTLEEHNKFVNGKACRNE